MASKKIQGITIKLGVDETALGKALKSIRNESKGISGELTQVNRLLKFDPGNTEVLAQKQTLLAKAVETSTKELDALKKAQGQVEDMFKNGDIGEKEYREFQRTVVQAEQSVKKYETQLKSLKTEEENLRNGTKQLNTLLEATGKSLDDFQDILGTRLTTALKNGTANSDDLTVAINKIGKAALGSDTDLEKMRAALNQIDSGGIDQVRQSLQELKAESNDTSDSLKGISEGVSVGNLMNAADQVSQLGDKVIELGQNAIGASQNIENAAAKVNGYFGETGAAAEENANLIKEIYENGVGDSFDSVANAVIAVKNNIKDLNQTQLSNITQQAITLDELYGIDMNESLRGVNSLMQHFGLDAESAMDLLVSGTQNGLDKTNELGDNLSEYAGKFAEAGYSAEEYFQLLQNGLESGAYNLDKVNDSINEVTTRLGDGTIADTIGSYSQETQDLFKQWQNGEATQKQVIDSIVSDINRCENQQEALNLASTAFGTMAEDGGLKVISSLTSIGDAYVNVSGKASEMQESTTTSAQEMEASMRKIQDALAPIGEDLITIMQPLLDFIADIAEGFNNLSEPVRKFIEVAGGIIAIIAIITPMIAAIITLNGALTALTGIGLLPLIGIIAAVVAAIAGIVAVIRNWGVITDWLSEKWESFKNQISQIWENIKDSAAETWDGIKKYFSSLWEDIKEGVADIWGNIQDTLASVWENITGTLEEAWNTISQKASEIWTGISDTIKTIWNGITEFFRTTWETIYGIFETPINLIKSIVEGTMYAIYAVIVMIWEVIKAALKAAWDWIADLANVIFTPLVEFFSEVWEKVSQTVSSVWETIKSSLKKAWDWITDTADSVFTGLSDFFSGIWKSISETASGIWEGIKSSLRAAWEWIKTTASSIFIPIRQFFSDTWNNIKNTATNVWNSIKSTLSGIWDGIKSNAQSAFSSIWTYIKEGFSNLRDTIGGIISGLANKIIKPIGNAINGVIKGVNWVLNAVGSNKSFKEWTVPTFAKGTGGIKKDTFGIVNDQKGSTYREMIVPPDGDPFIPKGRNVMLPLKKGTKIMPADETKEFLWGIPHFANGIGEFFGGVWENIKSFTGSVWDYITHPDKILQIAIDKFTDLTGAFEPWISVAKGAVNTVFGSVVDFIKGIFDDLTTVNYNPSAGVEQWRGLATRALQMTGQYSEANLNRLLMQMQTESGGNPNAINNWDINAKRGTPSKGLMQVIDPTFQAYKMPGYDNIWDPLSNMLAAIRYTLARYGSLTNGWRGHGYEEGIGKITLDDILPMFPNLDVKWFKEGGILTKPALFKAGSNTIGGAGEAGAEAIAPVKKLKRYIQESIAGIIGDKDINITINLSNIMDGKTIAKGTVKYTRPLLERADNFEKMLGGERV